MAKVVVTQKLNIKVADAPCNPVALYWMNKTSGWDMWVFGCTQTKGLSVQAGESFEEFIFDLQDANKRSVYLTKHSTPQLVLGYTNLSTSDVEGIKGLLDSPTVKMLIGDPATPKFRHVRVEPGSFKTIETQNDFHNLEFTISLAMNFNQEK
jgi:hypothetical protein